MSRAFFVDENEKFTEFNRLRSEVLNAATSVGRYYNKADDRPATGNIVYFVVDASENVTKVIHKRFVDYISVYY